jgi:two-component system, NarL family, invasion response regulator UvrY
MKKRILIADDHPMVRKGLMTLFAYYFDHVETAEACSCSETMRRLMKDEYSHLILDMVFRDGTVLEILPNIVSLFPRSRIMIFSMQPAGAYQRALKHYGIHNYLSKTLSEEVIVHLLGQFLNNERVVSEETDPRVEDNPFSLLTARELEILHYLLKGMGSNEIGDILNIRCNTVSTARTHILVKSRTHNIRELFELATRYHVT